MRSLIERDFRNAFEKCDVIATPTAPTPAFKLGEKADDPLAMYLSDIYTITANLSGVPALSLPCGLSSSGLPIGIQLIGKHFDEARLLMTAHNLETGLGSRFHAPGFCGLVSADLRALQHLYGRPTVAAPLMKR